MDEEKNAAAQSLTAIRNQKLSAKRRKEIAQTAAAARWKNGAKPKSAAVHPKSRKN